MTYRDDLAAAQARAAAAERRTKELERELGRVERADAQLALRAPPVPIPAHYAVERADDAVTIGWRWWRLARDLPTLLFTLCWDAILIAMYAGGDNPWGVLLFSIAHLAIGVGLTYEVLTSIFNRTTVRVSTAGVSIAHRPLPWIGGGLLARADIDQIYVRRVDNVGKRSTTSTWSLHVHLRSGRDRKLLTGLHEPAEAIYLERELERTMGIRDRPVEGEARDRALVASSAR